MILGPNGEKMSKSKGNVINPDDVINEYGADALRLYEMFMGPIEASKPWDEKGIEGSKKFIDRVWRVFIESDKVQNKENPNLEKEYNYTIKKVTEDYENMSFNTAIAQMMIFINAAFKEEIIPIKMVEGFIKVLNPIAPHITEEIWNKLGHEDTISYEKWPEYDESKIVDDKVNLAVQINGKLRDLIEINMDENQEKVKEIVHKSEKVASYIEGHEIVKEIYVKNKIYNIVIK